MLIDDSLLINCDWLQYSVITEEDEPELLCPDGFRLELYPGNNIFRNRALVFGPDGQKWLTLLWGPHSRILNPRLMTVQVANELLYDDMIGWADSVLRQVVSCRWNSMGRLDVCCDFVCTSRLWRVLRSLAAGSVYMCRKSEGSVFWHVSEADRSRVPHCLSWGSFSSEIRPKVYNKTYELNPDGGPDWDKPYIVNQWVGAGFDVHKVWRCEFSLKSSGQLQFDGKPISLADVMDDEWLGRVFCNLYTTRFSLRYADGKSSGHHNDDRHCEFLRVPAGDGSLSWRPSSRPSSPHSEAISLMRRMLTQLENQVAMSSPSVFDDISRVVLRCCDMPGVRSYFGWAYGCSPEAYISNLRSSCGDGVFFPDMSPSMKWN